MFQILSYQTRKTTQIKAKFFFMIKKIFESLGFN
jgi:hypothetical protein